jgi:cytidine deaminase
MTRRVQRSAAGPSAKRDGPRHVNPQQLLAQAETARRSSYSPYSRFAVGAALLTRGGRILHGCNVENASFGLSVCAERTALWKAISEGEREFVAVAIAAGPGAVPSPCGACRQVLHEFAPNLSVYWRDAGGRIIGRKLEELLASPFVFVDPPARGTRRAPKPKPATRRRK